MRPPSSWPAGNRFSAVTRNPNHAASAIGCVDTTMPSGSVPKRSHTSARVSTDSPNTRCGPGGAGTIVDQTRPSRAAGRATASPASGPAAAMSKSALRSRTEERMRMMAPRVPAMKIAGGAGMKKGRLTAAPRARAVK